MHAVLGNRSESTSGAIRFIDEAAVRRAMGAVKEFRAVSIGMPIEHGKGPVAPNRQPPQHYMRQDGGDYAGGCLHEKEGFGFSDDVLILATHGTTHVDALCHIFRDGKTFSGFSAASIGSRGAKHLGIESVPPLVTRALVVDAVPEGRPWLEGNESITAELLQQKLDAGNLSPERGDALIVRTGWMEFRRAGGESGWVWPGLSDDCIPWIRSKGFSIIGADNIAVEKGPSGLEGNAVPLHLDLLVGDGVLFLEMLDLVHARGLVAEAMLTLNPLRIIGGTASPVAPMLLY